MRYINSASAKKLKGKACEVRVDFNVESAHDAFRLEASVPTVKLLLQHGVRVVLLSHRGRPNGKRDMSVSLKPLLSAFQKKIRTPIAFLKDIPDSLPRNGKVFLLENLRFWKGEDENSRTFAKRLAALGDAYINDAFAVSHRANASVTQLPKLLPAYGGLLLKKEIETLTQVMKKPEKPLVMLFGGGKVEDKLPALKKLLPKAAAVLLGSSAIGREAHIPRSPKIMKPIDWVGTPKESALDIGSLTLAAYAPVLMRARTIIWNGPVGLFEKKQYAKGSIKLARVIAASTAFSVVGGGETTQLITQLKLEKKFGFLSTGGGAMLELLAGKKLPGIAVLQ